MKANPLMDKQDYVKRFTTLCLRSGFKRPAEGYP
jgi:hypothetical protein